MPKMDGIEATINMRKLLTETFAIEKEDQPLIVGCTGHATTEYHDKGIKAGMDRVLSKPLYCHQLKALL